MTERAYEAKVRELVDAGAEVERSLALRTGEEGLELRKAVYRGVREVSIGWKNKVEMFAVSIHDEHGRSRDILLARTPELAKFVADLLVLGDVLTADFLERMREES